MIKDSDDKPIEPARKKAERRWRNHDVERRFREEAKKTNDEGQREADRINRGEPKWFDEQEYAEHMAQLKRQKESRKLERERERIGTIIGTEKRTSGTVTRAQTKFAKEIRAMLEGHVKRNVLLCAISIRLQRKRLLQEKLRRLEAREADRMAQGTPK
jgi:hypothetical protein